MYRDGVPVVSKKRGMKSTMMIAMMIMKSFHKIRKDKISFGVVIFSQKFLKCPNFFVIPSALEKWSNLSNSAMT